MTRGIGRGGNPRRPGAIGVRAAAAGDTPFILSLAPRLADTELPRGRTRPAVARATRKFIDEALRTGSPRDCFLIAEDHRHQPVGFVHLRLERDVFATASTMHIANLAVVAQREGQGIGRALLGAAARWARSRRCTRLTLNVFPGNARALALYERAGFEPELVRMAKPLARVRRATRTPG